MDFIVAYPLSENAYKRMKWKYFEEYRVAKRQPFIVNGTLAGYESSNTKTLQNFAAGFNLIYFLTFLRYVKRTRNFIDAVILNAGHMVPTDQPLAALELIDRFIKDTL